MEDETIQQIRHAVEAYEVKVSRIKQLGYFLGSMYQSRDGRGCLQWWIRINGKKQYVRKSDYKRIRAEYHRGQHLRVMAKECLDAVNIALSQKKSKT
ncbi:hypothetical protein D0962_23040 [Leptolyngbyaceae cyanobacterium CCMR0082]|uniref:Uncharacterized protein n=2 Tax=Adonisia TaxID=2950183 RepID=A0A6M0SBB2_9CYAN|nr:hypothetical protein [Adonisia turfae CCMR0082]